MARELAVTDSTEPGEPTADPIQSRPARTRKSTHDRNFVYE